MQFIQFTAARADTGAVLQNARVTVYAAGTSTLAALFDVNGGSIGNPFQANINGLAGLAAADGLYDIQVQSADGSYTAPKMLSVQIVDLVALRGTVTSGRLGYATWAELAVVTGTAGQLAEVPITDTGTHTDPVVGGTVNNTGIFRYSTSPAGWKRIYDTDAASAKTYSDAAVAAEATLAPLLDVIGTDTGASQTVFRDAQKRPLLLLDGQGGLRGLDGNIIGATDLFANLGAALASVPGMTPQALFNADKLNAFGPRHLVRRLIFAWDEAIAISPSNTRCDSARFYDRVPFDATTGLITFSPRSAAANDDENLMKLSDKPYTLDGNGVPSFGAIEDIDIPAAFTAGTGSGASYNGGGLVVGANVHRWFQRLNGTYGSGTYDLYTTYRAVSGGSWSTPRLLRAGATSYAAFGVSGSGNGFTLVGGVNNVAVMGTKVIIPGYLPASPKAYLATLYVDQSAILANPATYTLSLGTALQYPSTTYNEPSFNIGPGGNGFFFIRDESGNARGVCKTTDGITPTFVRHDTALAIQNVACGFAYSTEGVPKGLVVGSIDPVAGNRQKAAIYLCYGSDLTPAAVVTDLWDPAERIEYPFVSWDAYRHEWVIDFEHGSIGTEVSFNQRVGGSEIRINNAELLARAVAL